MSTQLLMVPGVLPHDLGDCSSAIPIPKFDVADKVKQNCFVQYTIRVDSSSLTRYRGLQPYYKYAEYLTRVRGVRLQAYMGLY